MPERRSRQKRCGLDGKPEAFRTGRGKAAHQRHDTRDMTPETNILLTSILTKIETEVLVFEQAL